MIELDELDYCVFQKLNCLKHINWLIGPPFFPIKNTEGELSKKKAKPYIGRTARQCCRVEPNDCKPFGDFHWTKRNNGTCQYYSGWWFQPLWKICSSKWVHLPHFSGWKYLSCHHLVINPEPDLRSFWGDSLTKPPFGVTSAEVVLIQFKKWSWWSYFFLLLHLFWSASIYPFHSEHQEKSFTSSYKYKYKWPKW